MTSYEYDLEYIRGALGQLESYLLSDDLFWSINVIIETNEPCYPKLTIGNLLLFARRLKTHASTQAQKAESARIENQLYALQTHWRSAWEQKATREFTSRLRQWGNYLSELNQDPEAQAPFYATEVRWRLLLDILANETSSAPASADVYDPQFHIYFIAGEFIWDEEDQAAFPPDPYWYLYGKLITR